jgi:hypothetical protein
MPSRAVCQRGPDESRRCKCDSSAAATGGSPLSLLAASRGRGGRWPSAYSLLTLIDCTRPPPPAPSPPAESEEAIQVRRSGSTEGRSARAVPGEPPNGGVLHLVPTFAPTCAPCTTIRPRFRCRLACRAYAARRATDRPGSHALRLLSTSCHGTRDTSVSEALSDAETTSRAEGGGSDASICRPDAPCDAQPTTPPDGTALGKPCKSSSECLDSEGCYDYSEYYPLLPGGHCVDRSRACQLVTCPSPRQCGIAEETPNFGKVICVTED